MANVGSLRTSISLDSAQFQQSMQGVNRQLRGLKAETKAVTSSGTGFARGVTEMRSKADVLSRTLEVQQGKVSELRRRYEESRKATGENSQETQNANTAYQRAVAEMNKTEDALKGITKEIERQTNPWNKISENMENAGQKMQDVGRGVSDFGKSYSMRVTAPILGAAGAALKVGMDFEKGMSQVQAISGATGEDLEKMTDLAKEMGSETMFSATEAAGGMEFLAMSGMETNEIIETMPGLLDLAASSGMELARAADITTNILSGFGYEAEEAGRVSDVLAKGASTANTNVEQLGGAMETVAPIASMLDLDIEGLTAAVGKMSDSGIQGTKAGRMLRQGMLRLSDPTGDAADLIEELGINVFDADGNMKEMDKVVGELDSGLDGMSSKAQAAALSTIFGSESTAGWSALLEVGADDLKAYTKELQDSEGAASEMSKIMQDNAKGAMTEFSSALEGAGIALAEHMIPAVTNIVEKGTDLVRKFGEMDESTQQNIIKMGLFAAAIGPAAIVVGNLTTAIGGIVKVGGSLVGMLGGTGGLIARIASLGTGGVVGLAIAGVGLLATGIYHLTKDKEKLHDVNYDLIDGMMDEVDAMDESIDRFEELQNKSQLTTDEMLRYMDVLDELKKNKSEEELKKLSDEQENLLEKSGLTNDEMEEFLSLNDTIVEKSPNTVNAISEQGNAYAENTDEVRKLNNEERKRLQMQAYEELKKALENEVELRRILREEQEEQNRLYNEIEESQQRMLEIPKEQADVEKGIKEIKNAIKDIDEEMLTLSGEDLETAGRKKRQLEGHLTDYNAILEHLGWEEETTQSLIDKNIEKVNAKQDSIDATEEELLKIDNLKGDYENLILSQVDINTEKGKGVEAIEEEIKKIKQARDELDEKNRKGTIGTEEYRSQRDELNKQIGRLRDAQGELDKVNELAGKTVYGKKIEITTFPLIDNLEDRLSRPVRKTVNVGTNLLRSATRGIPGLGSIPMFAKGTGHHLGGPFVAGEEGYELGRLGDQWEMLNFGMYDRPSGYEVFTHDETKKILSSLNNMPAYAGGVSSNGEANRITSRINQQPISDSNGQVISLLKNIADGIQEGKVIQIGDTEIVQVVNEKNAVDALAKTF